MIPLSHLSFVQCEQVKFRSKKKVEIKVSRSVVAVGIVCVCVCVPICVRRHDMNLISAICLI